MVMDHGNPFYFNLDVMIVPLPPRMCSSLQSRDQDGIAAMPVGGTGQRTAVDVHITLTLSPSFHSDQICVYNNHHRWGQDRLREKCRRRICNDFSQGRRQSVMEVPQELL
jgi:hypothetical protein